MRSSIALLLILFNVVLCFVWSAAKKLQDEDFSQFDDFDEDEFIVGNPSSPGASQLPHKTQSDQANRVNNDDSSTTAKHKPTTESSIQDDITIADDEDDEDDDLMFDEEEFEASDLFKTSSSGSDLKITEVPPNLTTNRWEAYHCEAIMILVLLSYLINFLIGRSKNARLATTIFNSQRDLLERNFSLVGDHDQIQNVSKTDEKSNNDIGSNTIHKESESIYVLWCSGRVSIESMLMEIRFVKRQCLFNLMAAKIKSINDMITYTIDYGKDDMETFVFCLARKRSSARLHRDMNDLSQFCSERKNADKRGLTGNYQIINEIGEVSKIGDASSPIIDGRVVDFLTKYPDALEYIHISDQYTGTKAQSDNQQSSSNTSSTSTNVSSSMMNSAQQQDQINLGERLVRRVLIVAFNLIESNGRSLQVTTESVSSDYLRFVLYLADRVGSYRFSAKESKAKANKNRQRIEEQFLKSIYQKRQEQAQQRREEKRRAEKEKIMQCDDPEKQRKLEEKEHKREMKRKQPKMKQMKIKVM